MIGDRIHAPAPGPSEDLLAANEQLVLAMLQATVGAEQQARRLDEATQSAHLDPLTGLPDRLVFLDRVAQAITHARRHGSQLAILFVDLDRFKSINDTLGHAIGDRVLCACAAALAATVREADTVSRHGGDEFLVLLTEISNAGGAAVTARKLSDAVATSREIAMLGTPLTASIGVAVYPDDGLDANTLIDRADRAMYHAKKTGAGVTAFATRDEWTDLLPDRAAAAAADVAIAHPSPPSLGDSLYRQLREANTHLLVAALDAQSAHPAVARAPAYRALIDHMADGAISVDGDGTLLFCNSRFAALIDMDREELTGAPLASFFATVADAQAFRQLLERASIPDASDDFVLLDAKGRSVPVHIAVVDDQPVAAGGTARVISGIVTDLREEGLDPETLPTLTRRLHQAVVERGRAARRLAAALDAAGMGALEADLSASWDGSIATIGFTGVNRDPTG